MSDVQNPDATRTIGRSAIRYGSIGGVFVVGVVLGLFALQADAPSTDVVSTNSKPKTHAVAAPRRPVLSPEELYEHVAPSVVTIVVKDEEGREIGRGSGFLLANRELEARHADLERAGLAAWTDPNSRSKAEFVGYVLTNYQVMRPAVFADAVLSSGEVARLRYVIAEDAGVDLCLMLASVEGTQASRGIRLAISDPRVPATVYALGSQQGRRGSAREGKVSAYQETPGDQRWLQTTAPITPDSSGGPLLLADGTLAGVTTLRLTRSQELNFAVPVSAVRGFLATAAFHPRAVGEGAADGFPMAKTLDEMHAALESPHTSDAERNAISLLNRAYEETTDALLASNRLEERAARLRRIITLAQAADENLPRRFKHLMHYKIGAAYEILSSDALMTEDRVSTEDFEERLRARAESRYALYHLQKAIELDPGFAPAHVALALHHDIRGNWVDGLRASDALLEVMPRYAHGFGLRAKIYSKLDRLEESMRDMRTAIELSPLDASLHYSLALMLAESGAYSEAEALCERALVLGMEKRPNEVHHEIGRACWIGGHFESAVLEFTKAKAYSDSPELYDEFIAMCRLRKPYARWLAE